MDWQAWHDAYDVPDSWLARRLRAVQDRIRDALDTAPPGPLRAISVCAGQGRDLIGVLADHPRRDDVRARLVELDPGNTAAARESVRTAGLTRVEVVTGDASLTDHYSDLAPADLVLVCGVFGNVVDAGIERTIDICTRLCGPGGTVVWTRNRAAPDRVPLVCDWFEERGFERLWLSQPDAGYGVGAHRFTGEPGELAPGQRMFDFVGYDVLKAARVDARNARP
ncbi:SAM-dependent methyltransferase [Streptomyces sp. NPDC059832]|uniref:SAM-dependent methyltransferase n=1 Tax=unclassified Streptomyces TaxID=2593676 RepID=UPI00365B6B6B